MKDLIDPVETNEELKVRLDGLAKIMSQQLALQRFAAMGPDTILRFVYRGEEVAMYLPYGHYDYIQRQILNGCTFFEVRLLEMLEAKGLVKPGGVVIDAGANIGNHSVFFSRFMGAAKVYAFEPQPAVFDILQRNYDLNGVRGQAVQALLGAEQGRGSMSLFKAGNLGGCQFKADQDGTVPMVRLDDAIPAFEHTQISFVKIDVERAQVDLLKGATAILTGPKPPLWIEVFDDERPETDAFLADFGYRPQKFWRADWIYTYEG